MLESSSRFAIRKVCSMEDGEEKGGNWRLFCLALAVISHSRKRDGSVCASDAISSSANSSSNHA